MRLEDYDAAMKPVKYGLLHCHVDPAVNVVKRVGLSKGEVEALVNALSVSIQEEHSRSV